MRAILLTAGLLLAGLAGCLQTDDAGQPDAGTVLAPQDYVAPEVQRVDAAALLADHEDFVTTHNERADNKPTHESARQALLDLFASYGLETYRQNFTRGGLEQANILGIKWGHVRDQWVVVGAHYDTTTDDCLVDETPDETPSPGPVPPVPLPTTVENPCPLRALSQGAYDDGSGTMMTVHLAKAFANVTPYYTIVFVPWDGEERGTQGSQAFRDAFITGGEDGVNFTTPYGQVRVRGVIDLDMVGLNWPGTTAPMNVYTNSEVAWDVANNSRNAMGWPDEQWHRKASNPLGTSDYGVFWSLGEEQNGPIPTIFFISDFDELGIPNPNGEAPEQAYTPIGAYPFWHLQDTVETMTAMAGGYDNLEAGFQSAVDVAFDVLHSMAMDPTLEYDAVAVQA